MDTLDRLVIRCSTGEMKAIKSQPYHYDLELDLLDVDGDFLNQIPVKDIVSHYDNVLLLDELDDDIMFEYLEKKGALCKSSI